MFDGTTIVLLVSIVILFVLLLYQIDDYDTLLIKLEKIKEQEEKGKHHVADE